MAKNVLQEMNAILYESLTKLSDESLSQDELKKEIVRSNALTSTAKELLNNINTAMNIMKYADKKQDSIDNICRLTGVTIDE